MKKLIWTALAGAAIVSGCATPEASTEPIADRGEVITGSNIPRKRNQLPSEVRSIDGKHLDPALSSPLKTPDTPGMGK